MTLSWESSVSTITSLYKSVSPKLVYHVTSRDESVNKCFIKQMDMYLFKNYQVVSVLVGEHPHPFVNYPRLKQYWKPLGYDAWEFDPTKTCDMFDVIRENGHDDFHRELTEILWFGGVVSYDNLIRETYTTIYSWINESDLPDLEDITEDDDGVTFRKVV